MMIPQPVNKMSREDCISWLCWNDPNGTYRDEDSRAEGTEPITLEQARALILEQVARGIER